MQVVGGVEASSWCRPERVVGSTKVGSWEHCGLGESVFHEETGISGAAWDIFIMTMPTAFVHVGYQQNSSIKKLSGWELTLPKHLMDF